MILPILIQTRMFGGDGPPPVRKRYAAPFAASRVVTSSRPVLAPERATVRAPKLQTS